MSDSASTRKLLSKLIEERRLADEEQFGLAVCTTKTPYLIETFCSMYLGVNLRKAFLSGTGIDERHHGVDVFVHEFCF